MSERDTLDPVDGAPLDRVDAASVDAPRAGRSRPHVVPGPTPPEWQRTAPRLIAPSERLRCIGMLGQVLDVLGLPAGTPGTSRTPERLFDALYEATSGYEGDPRALTLFPAERERGRGGDHDQIVEGPIRFEGLCEHHALPFVGDAFVGYVAGDAIVGISKLTRIVRVFARRFTVQERLGNEVAAAIEAQLDADGAGVVLRATHTCTLLRGVRESGTETVTASWRGVYERNPALRGELLALVAGRTGTRRGALAGTP